MTKVLQQEVKDKYAIYNADTVEMIQNVPDNSIHYTLFSPPFSSLYTYSNSDRDMGNCKGDDEFMKHFQFLAKELYRVTMPGRLLSFHCMDLPLMKSRDGVIGLKDFPAILRQIFEDCGFIYHSKVTIFKNPVTEMQRTKALGLLHKQIRKDSSMCRQGIPDYIVTMRKPGENPEMIPHTHESFPVDVWQQYASPVWMDIRQSDTLQRTSARSEKDEKHICFAEGTLILTKRGYIPIEDVIPYEDETLTHKGRWQRIIAKAMTKENADVVQTKACGVPNLVSTANHKLYAKHPNMPNHFKKQLDHLDAEWVEAKNCENHYLCSQIPPQMDSTISAKEWWIIGRWLADGHIDARGRQFFISVGKSKYAEFINQASDYVGHVVDKTTECNTYQIGLKGLSKYTRDFLFRCGNGAQNKRIPLEGISLNQQLSESLLSGYLSGDGYVNSDGKIYASSVSRSLLLGMAIVIHNARGLSSSVYQGRDEHTSQIRGRQIHCSTEWFLCASPHYSFNKVEDTTEWKKVKSIIPVGTANVWSIQVENDASYTAEGCVVKNCPLQLEVIQRCIELWTNPNDIVFDPFAGIGSVPYIAVKMGRRGIGCELKESYYDQAKTNLRNVSEEATMDCAVGQMQISDVIGEDNVIKITFADS